LTSASPKLKRIQKAISGGGQNRSSLEAAMSEVREVLESVNGFEALPVMVANGYDKVKSNWKRRLWKSPIPATVLKIHAR
jgi:hypothetical protein